MNAQNYTQKTVEAVQTAQSIATTYGSPQIEQCHLLLALLEAENGLEAVGILHDLDFERWPDEHCVKCQELMGERGIDPSLIRAAASHGWPDCVDLPPELEMEKVLFAVDELTGLIGAAADRKSVL